MVILGFCRKRCHPATYALQEGFPRSIPSCPQDSRKTPNSSVVGQAIMSRMCLPHSSQACLSSYKHTLPEGKEQRPCRWGTMVRRQQGRHCTWQESKPACVKPVGPKQHGETTGVRAEEITIRAQVLGRSVYGLLGRNSCNQS